LDSPHDAFPAGLNSAVDNAEGDEAMGLVQMDRPQQVDPLLTAEDVAARLNVSKDWVWDHSSRKLPYLPVIRMSDGTLLYRASQIEEFVNERERASALRRRRR
jgi:predicted DNA-binding transcriptional regulator AlpA